MKRKGFFTCFEKTSAISSRRESWVRKISSTK
jgi:hypothetical protein